MVANSNLLGGVCSLLTVWVAQRDLGDNFLAIIQVSDLNVVPSLGSGQVCMGPLGGRRAHWLWFTLATVHTGHGSHWPGHHVHLHQALE